ncbi:WXG100 family type VII secretion target [Actinokineospora sp. NPDC004072]
MSEVVVVGAVAKGGPDGADVEAGIGPYLDFLSRLCAELGVPDPVEDYFAPVVGRWSDLHAEAERYRAVGAVAEQVSSDLTGPLGGLDAAWQGADADSFIDYMNKVGLAGNDMADAMTTMADVLDETADGLREIVVTLADMLVDTAETAGGGRGLGDDRTRFYLDQMRRPGQELFESVRQVLDALVQLCEGIDGSAAFKDVAMAHTFPETDWTMTAPQVKPVETETPSVPSAGGAGGGGGFGGGGFGGGGAGGVGSATSPPAPGDWVAAGEAAQGKQAPAAGAAAAAAGGGAAAGRGMGMGGMGMMPMGGGMMGQQGGGTEHKPRNRVQGKPEDIFGKPAKASPSVIGDD